MKKIISFIFAFVICCSLQLQAEALTVTDGLDQPGSASHYSLKELHPIVEAAVLEEINEVRGAMGLSLLTRAGEAYSLASYKHSRYLFEESADAHAQYNSGSPYFSGANVSARFNGILDKSRYYGVGEVITFPYIEYVQATTKKSTFQNERFRLAVRDWFRSLLEAPYHMQILIDPEATALSVGMYASASGESNYVSLVVNVFFSASVDKNMPYIYPYEHQAYVPTGYDINRENPDPVVLNGFAKQGYIGTPIFVSDSFTENGRLYELANVELVALRSKARLPLSRDQHKQTFYYSPTALQPFTAYYIDATYKTAGGYQQLFRVNFTTGQGRTTGYRLVAYQYGGAGYVAQGPIARPGTFQDVPQTHRYYAEIQTMYEAAIIGGYEQLLFKPEEYISRQHVAQMLNRLEVEWPQLQAPIDFKDVDKASAYYEAIQALQQAGIISGDKGYFKPAGQLTRAQMAKILVNAFDLEVQQVGARFKDVPADAWYKDYVATLAAYGITTGDNGYFKPNAYVSRQHFAVFLYRAILAAS